MKTYTKEEVAAQLKELILPMQTSLNSIMDRVPAIFKPDVTAMVQKLNEQLSKLGPLEQVPAAQEIGWAIERLCCSLQCANEIVANLTGRMSAMATESAGATTELCGLKKQISDKELLGKAEVESLTKLAEEKGVKSVQGEILAARKNTLELAGIPVPGDDIMNLPASEYTPRFEQAKKNVGALKSKLGDKAAEWITRGAWETEKQFASTEAMLTSVLPPKKEEKPDADPMLGAPGNTNTKPRKFAGMA